MYTLQDPSSTLNWAHDWSNWLAVGDSIASRQWTITPTATLQDATTASVKVDGLTVGQEYRLTEAITTANGLQAERTIIIRAEQL